MNDSSPASPSTPASSSLTSDSATQKDLSSPVRPSRSRSLTRGRARSLSEPRERAWRRRKSQLSKSQASEWSSETGSESHEPSPLSSQCQSQELQHSHHDSSPKNSLRASNAKTMNPLQRETHHTASSKSNKSHRHLDDSGEVNELPAERATPRTVWQSISRNTQGGAETVAKNALRSSQKTSHSPNLQHSSQKKLTLKRDTKDTERPLSPSAKTLVTNGAAASTLPHNASSAQISDVSNSNPETSLNEYIEKKVAKVSLESLGRSGGVYIPPFKLARLQAQITDTTSVEYQRQSWEALRKSINGLVNKISVGNITLVVQELFKENLIRGRGLFARAVLRAQMASPGFTHVYAAMVAIVNSKLPNLGELVIKRCILQFRRAYRRNDKIVCLACVKFIAHLVNQRVVHELMALQLAALLLEKSTDDSVEVAVGFISDVGQVLSTICKKGFEAIFERVRAILQEGTTEKKTQYTIEKLWELRRTNFCEFPGVLPELDLVHEDDQIIHDIDLLDENIKGEEMLNIFKSLSQEEYEEQEKQWKGISNEILGEESEVESDSSTDSEDEGVEDEPTEELVQQPIKDYTEQDLINLRKAVYLTIMSSVNYEECLHKLLKLNIKSGQEMEVVNMLLDCCAMERTFQTFFALQAQRLSQLNQAYAECLIESFRQQYLLIHRYETNKIRNIAKFFAHLLYTDSIPWAVLENFVLSEDTTSSSGRIFIKIIFQDLSEHLGLTKLSGRLKDPALAESVQGLFPSDHPRSIRFAINFFTAIGLGGLTDELRAKLSAAQQNVANAQSRKKLKRRSRSSSSSSSSSD